MSTPSSFQSGTLKATKLLAEDAETLFSFYSDSEAMKFRGSPVMKTLEDASKMINEQVSDINQTRRLRLGIRLKYSDELIGTLLLCQNKKQECEIGFRSVKNTGEKATEKKPSE